jgi:hypothetical protein
MSLEEISGVQQVDIPSADAQLARDIDAIIDPLRQDDGEKKPE